MNDNLCKLCLEQKTLVESHIISEFEYKPLYDSKHRYHAISSNPNYEKTLQKGLREKLLCKDCEVLRSKYERYVSMVMNGGIELGHLDFPGGTKLTCIDYNKFKIYQLFLLWIASVSKLRVFSAFQLNPRVEEDLRKMLISETPCKPEEYSCHMTAILGNNGKPIRSLILPPSLLEDNGLVCARFLISGLLWTFIISEPPQDFIDENCFLTLDGTLTVYYVHPKDIPFIQGTLASIIMKKLNIDRDTVPTLKRFLEYDLWEKID